MKLLIVDEKGNLEISLNDGLGSKIIFNKKVYNSKFFPKGIDSVEYILEANLVGNEKENYRFRNDCIHTKYLDAEKYCGLALKFYGMDTLCYDIKSKNQGKDCYDLRELYKNNNEEVK